jgi:hypothetical protein
MFSPFGKSGITFQTILAKGSIMADPSEGKTIIKRKPYRVETLPG